MQGQVLVIDDDPQILQLFGTILERGGYSVLLAPSGEAAMDFLHASQIDVVVLDLNMPAPDGFELLKSLRKSAPDLRVVVVSGYLQGSLLKAAELLGAAATVAKTEAPGLLLPTVDDVLRRR